MRLVKASRDLSVLKRRSRLVSISLTRERNELPPIYASPEVHVPLTSGLLRPWIVLPEAWRDWDKWKLKAVLYHELAHIRRRDCLVSVLTSFATCVYWFNPLSWWLARELSVLSEKAADEASVLFTGDAPRYAQVLLDFAAEAQMGRRVQIGVVPMAATRIRSRIDRILSMNRGGGGVLKRTTWFLVLTLCAPALYVASAVRVSRSPVQAIGAAPVLRPTVKQPEPPQARTAPAVENPLSEERVIEALTIQAERAEPVQENLGPPASLIGEYARQVAAYYQELAEQRLSKQHLSQTLAVLEQRHETLLGLYTPRMPEVVQLEAQINRIRAELAEATAAENAMTSQSPDGDGMILDKVQDRTVFFRSADGTRSFSYGCGDCTFFVGPNRVGSSEDGLPGALVHLSNDGKQLEMTCRVTRCHVIIFKGDEAEAFPKGMVHAYTVPEMKTGGSLTIPADSHAVMLFN
jgi:hypothetical protein